MTKGYIVWNYWDHCVVTRTTDYQVASAALDHARKAALQARRDDWFGIEAVEDINGTAV